MYMDESMNALADKAHKHARNATQWYALHNTATFSSNWHATATYVGMVVE